MTPSSAGESPSRTRTIVLVAVFVALAVAVFFVWRRGPGEPDFDAGREAADRFLSLVRGGQAAQAWESTTAEFKSYEGRESFLKTVQKHPELAKPMQFVSVQTVTLQDAPRAEYLYRAADGKATVRLLAGNERDTWRVDRMKLD